MQPRGGLGIIREDVHHEYRVVWIILLGLAGPEAQKRITFAGYYVDDTFCGMCFTPGM